MSDDNTRLEVTSIYGAKTKRGLVRLTLGETSILMEVKKAREVHGMLGEAIEAAISDELIVRFLMTKGGLGEVAAAKALLDFRELRQGSRDVVYPT